MRIAIDDFGTGYSSLGYLRQRPIDVLKIDKTFIDDMVDSAAAARAGRPASSAWRSTLNLTVIAEGIETPRHREMLARLGCPLGQGYLYSSPMGSTEALTWMATPGRRRPDRRVYVARGNDHLGRPCVTASVPPARRHRGRALAVAALGGAGVGYAASPPPPPQPAIQTTTPHSEHDITNIDVLRQQIRNYYGDPLGTGVFAADSNYAKEARRVARTRRALPRPAAPHPQAPGRSSSTSTTRRWPPGTTRSSATGRTTRRPTPTYVTGQLFPAVPGMVRLATTAEREGYAIFFLTGRPAAAGGGHARQPHRGRHGRGRRLPEADHAARRRGRPVHQAGRRRLPGLPEGRLRRRPERLVHHRSTTSRRPGRTSSRSATTSWPTSATSTAT